MTKSFRNAGLTIAFAASLFVLPTASYIFSSEAQRMRPATGFASAAKVKAPS